MSQTRRPRLTLAGVATLVVGMSTVGFLGMVHVDAGEILVDDLRVTTTPTSDPQDVDVAYDAINGEYLVVWEDQAAGASFIRGAYVEGDTGVVEAPFTVSSLASTSAIEPAVSWRSDSGFVVVYSTATDVTTYEIEAAAVEGAAVESRLTLSAANAALTEARRADITTSSTGYFVAWDAAGDTTSLGNREVFGANIVDTVALALSGLPGRVSANTGADAVAPAVAGPTDDGTVMVVAGREVDGIPVGIDRYPATLGAGTAPVSISGATADQHSPSIAADIGSDQFLVAWEESVGGQAVVAGTQIESNGTLGFTLALPTAGTSAFDRHAPDVAYNATTDKFIVAWHGAESGITAADEYEIFSTVLTADSLSIFEPIERLTTMGTNGAPSFDPQFAAVSSGPARTFGMFFTSDNPDGAGTASSTIAGDFEVFGQLISETADLRITKTLDTPFNPAPGDPFTYTITYTNAGRSPSAGIVISDAFPSGLVVAAIDTTAAPGLTLRAGSTYVWDLASLPVDGTGTIIISGTVAGNTINGQQIDNTAVVVGDPLLADPSVDNEGDAATIIVDTPPSVTVNEAPAQSDPTNSLPIRFIATFDEAVTDFTTSDVTLTQAGTTGASVISVSALPTPPNPANSYEIVVGNVVGDGTITATVPAGGVVDSAGKPNFASTSTDNSVEYDTTPPTVVVTRATGQPALSNAPTAEFAITFDEAVNGFTASDLVVSGPASAGTILSLVSGGEGDTEYVVEVSNISTDGELTANVPAAAATDLATNPNGASGTATVTIDQTPPTVTINQAGGQADPTNDTPIVFTATFSEEVTLFTSGDVTLSSGTATVTGGPSVYTVSVTGMSQGALTATIAADVAIDAAGNTNVASASTDNTVVYDTVAPTAAITQDALQADPTNGSTATFRVTFSEDVGTSFSDVDVTVGGVAGASSTGTTVVKLDAITYDVILSGIDADGIASISVGTGTFIDLSGNSNTAAATETDNSVLFDFTGPTLTLVQAVGQADPVNTLPILFTATFSEGVTGFDGSDVDLSGTANPATASVTGGPSIYTISVDSVTNDGTVTVGVDADVAVDSIGNGNLAATNGDVTVTYDTARPTVTVEQAAIQADPTNALPIRFTITFNEPVTGLTDSDITLTSGTVETLSGSGTTYTAEVTGVSDGATVTATIAAGVATDAAGNTNLASASTDNNVTYDSSVPSVSIDEAAGQADPTNVGAATFDVTFSESVSGFDEDDIILGGTAASGTTLVAVTGGPVVYTVSLTGITNDGTVTISVAAGAATDSAGNGNTASTAIDNEVTIDLTAPSATLDQAVTQIDPTNAMPIRFTATFSEPVSGFDDADVIVTGTAGATDVVVTGGPSVYGITVSNPAGDGSVVATLAAGAAFDPAGNPSGAAVSEDATVLYDATAPSVTINQSEGQADPTDELPVSFTVTFSEPVSGFDAADIVIGGDTGASVAVVSGSGTTYTVTVSGATEAGTITADVPAGAADDNAGNTSAESSSTDNSVTITAQAIDNTDPVLNLPDNIEVDTDPGQDGAVVSFAVTATDDGATGTNQAHRTLSAAATGAGDAPTVTCTPPSGSFFVIGTTTVTCTATDEAANSTTGTFNVTVVDRERPTFTQPATNQTAVIAVGTSGIVTYITPVASDNSGSATVTCTPPSGSVLAIGDNTITCTVTDAAGNTTASTFVVTVSSSALPATGTNSTDLINWALTLTVLGGVLIATAATNRRRLRKAL
ncbi:MAG TPA: Ig-like domain-containing protein [Ilumatobacter sp.]|nr:Ig-like domain-containing protein [Ilumatobacter sp.]